MTKEELPSTAVDAKAVGSKIYFTGVPCKRGHFSVRLTINHVCKECKDNNPNQVKLQVEWAKAHPEAGRDCRNNWHKTNKAARRAIDAARRAAEARATVTWADRDKIREIYEEARRLELEDGIPRHVDHIYPLRGKNVRGLHCEFNLQILTKEDNLKKGNAVDK